LQIISLTRKGINYLSEEIKKHIPDSNQRQKHCNDKYPRQDQVQDGFAYRQFLYFRDSDHQDSQCPDGNGNLYKGRQLIEGDYPKSTIQNIHITLKFFIADKYYSQDKNEQDYQRRYQRIRNHSE